MRVLVTGAEGFIGSHLTEALVSAGYEVRAMVQYNSFGSSGWLKHLPPSILSEIEVIHSDIRDSRGCDAACNGMNAVVHLAALIAIPHSYDHPASYVDTNIKGTQNLLEAALKNNVDAFIQTSTSEVYGSAEYVPIDEEHPLNPQSPYAASKVGADQLARAYWASFQLPVVVLRPFNTFGPRQSQRAVIPAIISQFLQSRPTLRLGSLSPTRDFTYVTDTVGGFIAALKFPQAIGKTVNLGTGFEISIGKVVELIAEEFGVFPEIDPEEERMRPERSEVTQLLAANQKAKSLIGWEPRYRGIDGFRLGLAKTIEWHKWWITNGGQLSSGYIK
jgi:NAD dependent epimerase/dehydratase